MYIDSLLCTPSMHQCPSKIFIWCTIVIFSGSYKSFFFLNFQIKSFSTHVAITVHVRILYKYYPHHVHQYFQLYSMLLVALIYNVTMLGAMLWHARLRNINFHYYLCRDGWVKCSSDVECALLVCVLCQPVHPVHPSIHPSLHLVDFF